MFADLKAWFQQLINPEAAAEQGAEAAADNAEFRPYICLRLYEIGCLLLKLF